MSKEEKNNGNCGIDPQDDHGKDDKGHKDKGNKDNNGNHNGGKNIPTTRSHSVTLCCGKV